MNNGILSTTPSDKQLSVTNSIEKLSAVSLIVHKSIINVPTQEESRGKLKEEGNAFAIDMVIPQPGSKQYVLSEEYCPTDQDLLLS